MTCPLTTPSGKVCYFVADHPGRVHVDLSDGGMVVWSLPDATPFANRPAVPADPLQDAPAALRKDTCACGWSPEEHDPTEHSPAPHVQVRPPSADYRAMPDGPPHRAAPPTQYPDHGSNRALW